MFASGLYFVSSIMGVGDKNNGVLLDKHYRKIFRSQQEMYRNPDDEDYATLYKYNIMPPQIKKSVEEYSAECPNLIYANSGLYCIEQEMENFASRHAAYNKCQMVHKFLTSVIEETNQRIVLITDSQKRTREARRKELETQHAVIIEKVSRGFVKYFVATSLCFRCEIGELEKIIDSLHQKYAEERNFGVQEKEWEESQSKIILNVKKNSRDILNGEGKFLERLGKMKDDLVQDYADLRISKGEKIDAERVIDRETSVELHQIII